MASHQLRELNRYLKINFDTGREILVTQSSEVPVTANDSVSAPP